MGKKVDINKEMMILEIVNNYPEAKSVLTAYGLHCTNCPASSMETLEQGALSYGMPDEVIDMMIRDANATVKAAKV